MIHEQAARKLAIARGSPLARSPAIPRNVVAAIGSRVAEWPQGTIRTYDDHDKGRAVSYLELWQRSGRVASGLRTLGLRADTRVVLLIEDAADFVCMFWACLRSGLTAVPLTSVAREERGRGQPSPFWEALGRPNEVIVVADERCADFAAALHREHGLTIVPLAAMETKSETAIEDALPAEPACIVATSGSTGLINSWQSDRRPYSIGISQNR